MNAFYKSALFLVALSSASAAVAAPKLSTGQKVTVRPGERVRVSCRADADWQQRLEVWDQLHDKKVFAYDNYFAKHGTWTSPRNSTGTTQVYVLYPAHKECRGDDPKAGHHGWEVSARKTLDNTRTLDTFGFDDGVDGDYNDVVCTVAWL